MDRSYPSLFAARFPRRRPSRSVGALRRRAGGLLPAIALALVAAVAGRAAETGPILGLPFTRFYSFEEIGNASRGARLGFDALGRLAVIHQGSYVVLNDGTWIDIADKKVTVPKMQQVVFEPDGRAYYGAFGAWGVLERTPEGTLRPRSLLPATYPKWVMASNFVDVVPTRGGVCFAGFNGVAYWDRATNGHVFFEVPQLSRVFAIRDQMYAWSHREGIQQLDFGRGSLHTVAGVDLWPQVVDQVTVLDEGRVLASTVAGRLLVFDGTHLKSFPGPLGDQIGGRISALRRLVDGTLAIAVNGKGLYVVSAAGDILLSLTSPEYHRVTDLANREAGVLWVATENGVEKILYENALTVFGQRLGLPISWPQVVSWRNRVVVASGGRVYDSVPGAPGDATRFELIPHQPTAEIWAIAANGERLLIGNPAGIFARSEDGSFVPVLAGMDVARLVMPTPELCFAIGTREIAALHWDGERWSECAARVAPVGYPAVVHSAKNAAWVELAANRVARIGLRDGAIQVRLLERFPWAPEWVNIGIVGDTVVLGAPQKGRLYFDEVTETLIEAPPLEQLLKQSPFPISRVRGDEGGTIWATYERGLLMFPPATDGRRREPVVFSIVDDLFPFIQPIRGGGVWLSTGHSLYHVDRRKRPQAEPAFRPTLVSIVDGSRHREVFNAQDAAEGPLQLTYAENNLMFRFFAGSYAARRPPAYEFTLNRSGDTWVPLGTGSLLTLNDLREGRYRLSVRLAGARDAEGDPGPFEFEIAPPWFRTWYAYALYGLGGLTAVWGLIRLSVYRTRSRNLVLERTVRERTDELRAAMQQLNEETRNAATVAERDRLAGEIHDSLQQGLSGLILQLDATLKLPGLSPDVRSRLNVARNMVSFTRHEVQHAVWDMESPLLEDAELGTALQKMAALISPGTPQVEINVSGSSAALSSSTRHHLLRIAQEAITNAVRHAAARTITLNLACGPDSVALSVSDDGNGFVPDEVLSNGLGHFGLRGLRGRAGKIGGEIQIQSAPGQGTVIRIVVNGASAYSHAATR